MIPFEDWQAQVRATLKHHMDWDEYHLLVIDWQEWHPLYDAGYSSAEAVGEALMMGWAVEV